MARLNLARKSMLVTWWEVGWGGRVRRGGHSFREILKITSTEMGGNAAKTVKDDGNV